MNVPNLTYVSIVSYGFHVFTIWMLDRLEDLLEIKQALEV